MNNIARCVAFCTISAAGASAHKQFTARHRRYPFKIFQALLDPARADAIDADPRCEMDPWSVSIVESGDHRSAVGRAKLILLCHLVYTSNARGEVGHAHSRRWVKSREQTHAMTAMDLSSFWISERVRSDAAKGPCNGAAGSGGQYRPPRDTSGPALKRRKRCGGAWRAYVREQATSNLRCVAEAYRNLPLAERERLCEVGRAATRDGRAGNAEGTAFGLRRREAERRHKKRLAAARIQRLSADMARVSVSTVLQLAEQDNDSASMSVKLRMYSRALAETERSTREEDVRAIETYLAANNNVVAASILAAVPQLAPVAHCLSAEPLASQGCVVARLAVDASARAADAILLWADSQRSARGTANIHKVARDHWVGLHAQVCSPCDGEDDAPLDDERPTSPCFRAGLCICSVSGRKLHTFRNFVLEAIKRAFPRADVDRRRSLVSQRCLHEDYLHAIGTRWA